MLLRHPGPRLSYTNVLIQLLSWEPAGFFPRVGNEGDWRTEAPQQGPGAVPRWGSGGKAPRSWWHFLKMMHKYFIYWGFRHLQQKKHFSTLEGEAAAVVISLSCIRINTSQHVNKQFTADGQRHVGTVRISVLQFSGPYQHLLCPHELCE